MANRKGRLWAGALLGIVLLAVAFIAVQRRSPVNSGGRDGAPAGRDGNVELDETNALTASMIENDKPVPDYADKAVEDAVQATVDKVSGVEMPGVSASLPTMEKSAKTRRNVKLALPTYAEKKDELMSKVGENWSATAESVPNMVRCAKDLTESFWAKGDFDDPSSFDDIYEARAILEECRRLAPDSEEVLRAEIEVVQAGWPQLYGGDEISHMSSWDEDDWRVYSELNLEGQMATTELVWQLWREHVSHRENVTADDLSVVFEALALGPPLESIIKKIESAHPGIKPGGQRSQLVLKEVVQALQPLRDWALDACKNKPEWEVYVPLLEAGCESLEKSGFCSTPRLFMVPFTLEESRRYWGRGGLFQGPINRRIEGFYYHEKTR